MKELEYVEIAVHFGKEDNEEAHIRITGKLDKEFFEELEQLMLEHNYTYGL